MGVCQYCGKWMYDKLHYKDCEYYHEKIRTTTVITVAIKQDTYERLRKNENMSEIVQNAVMKIIKEVESRKTKEIKNKKTFSVSLDKELALRIKDLKKSGKIESNSKFIREALKRANI